MKASKTFKIGEYAIGGIIQVKIDNSIATIYVKDWDTSAGESRKSKQGNAEVLMKEIFDFNSARVYRDIDDFLNEVTSSYYATLITDWIELESNVKKDYSYFI